MRHWIRSSEGQVILVLSALCIFLLVRGYNAVMLGSSAGGVWVSSYEDAQNDGSIYAEYIPARPGFQVDGLWYHVRHAWTGEEWVDAFCLLTGREHQTPYERYGFMMEFDEVLTDSLAAGQFRLTCDSGMGGYSSFLQEFYARNADTSVRSCRCILYRNGDTLLPLDTLQLVRQ